MKAWLVEFDGSYLGGKAIVVGATAEEARDVLLTHSVAEFWKRDIQAESCTIVEIPMSERCLLFFDDGDY